jgi:hypothetical protein
MLQSLCAGLLSEHCALHADQISGTTNGNRETMKHAGQTALDALEPLLAQLRALGEMREKSRGVFYLRAQAFLHFHEDSTGLYADLRAGDGFERFKVDTSMEQRALVDAVRRRLTAITFCVSSVRCF